MNLAAECGEVQVHLCPGQLFRHCRNRSCCVPPCERVHDGPQNPGDEASVVNFRWRGASSEPVHHCVSASMDTAHVGLVTPRSEVWGSGSVHPRGSDGALGQWLQRFRTT